MKVPCKDCEARCYKCHSTCKRYKEYREHLVKAKKKQRDEEYADVTRWTRSKIISSKYRFGKNGNLRG